MRLPRLFFVRLVRGALRFPIFRTEATRESCVLREYCYRGTIALLSFPATFACISFPPAFWGSEAMEAISWAMPVRRSNTW